MRKYNNKYFASFVGGDANGNRKKRFEEYIEKLQLTCEQKARTKLFTAGDLSKFLTYEDYLNIIRDSEVLFDLYRLKDFEGYSYRIAEGVALGKKIVTDRKLIMREPFYSPEQFFVIGVDNPCLFQSFLKKKIQKDKMDKLSDSSQWWLS